MTALANRPTGVRLKERFLVYDTMILVASIFSLLLSVYLWFTSSKEQGVFVGLWVPSIVSIGIYIRIMLKERL